MKKILSRPLLLYLKILAKVQLAKVNPVVIGVGGASGKSSVSRLIAEVLSGKFKVKESRGKNSESGIPLNILGIELESYNITDWLKAILLAPVKILTNWEKYDFYVVEMGIDGPYPPKNMSYLLGVIQPKLGILTNINIEHSQFFDSLTKEENELERKKYILDATAKQELLLLTSIKETGRSIVNLDDPIIASALPLSSITVTVSATDKSADFYISKIINTMESFNVSFVFLKENYEITLSRPLPKYYAHSLIFTIAAAFSSGINIRESINLAESKFSLPPGRFSVFKGIKNSTIFDSSYNSSLESSSGVLDVLNEVGKGERKVGILGDMRELGSLGKIQHEQLAKEIIKNLDFAVLIGPLMQEFAVPVLKKENFEYKSFNTFKEAKDIIPGLILKEDLILVKGSQNTLFLERAVEILLSEKSDRDRLCRRGTYWDKRRKESS